MGGQHLKKSTLQRENCDNASESGEVRLNATCLHVLQAGMKADNLHPLHTKTRTTEQLACRLALHKKHPASLARARRTDFPILLASQDFIEPRLLDDQPGGM